MSFACQQQYLRFDLWASVSDYVIYHFWYMIFSNWVPEPVSICDFQYVNSSMRVSCVSFCMGVSIVLISDFEFSSVGIWVFVLYLYVRVSCVSFYTWILYVRVSCVSLYTWILYVRVSCVSFYTWILYVRVSCVSLYTWILYVRVSCVSFYTWISIVSISDSGFSSVRIWVFTCDFE